MTALGELPSHSTTYVRTQSPARLRTQHEVPGSFQPEGTLMLGAAERPVQEQAVPESRSPGPGRAAAEERGVSGGGSDLRAPFVTDALLLRLDPPRGCQGNPHDERQRPAHAVRRARAAR